MFNQALANIGNWLTANHGFGGGAYATPENSINQYTQQGVSYLQPYSQMGQQVGNSLNSMFGQFSNPEQAYNNFARNYQMSPGAQNQLHTGMNAVSNQMAQMGLSQSGPEQQALAKYSQGIINQDMNSQWNNMLQGGELGARLGLGMYGTGADAASREAGLYGQAGEDEAELQEAEAQQKAAQKAADSQSEWGLAGDALGFVGSKWL